MQRVMESNDTRVDELRGNDFGDDVFDDEGSDDGWIEDSKEDSATMRQDFDPDLTSCTSLDVVGDTFNVREDQTSAVTCDASCRREIERKDTNVLGKQNEIKKEVEDFDLPGGQSFDAQPYSDNFTESRNITIKKEKMDDDFTADPLLYFSSDDVHAGGTNKLLKRESDCDVFDGKRFEERTQSEQQTPGCDSQIKLEHDESVKTFAMDAFVDTNPPTLIGDVSGSQTLLGSQLYLKRASTLDPLKSPSRDDKNAAFPDLCESTKNPVPDGISSATRSEVTKYSSVDEYVDWLSDLISKGNKKNIVLKGPTNLIRDVTKKVNDKIQLSKVTKSYAGGKLGLETEVASCPNKQLLPTVSISRFINSTQSPTILDRVLKSNSPTARPNTACVTKEEALRLRAIPKDIAEELKGRKEGSPTFVVNHRALGVHGYISKMKPVQFCVKAPEDKAKSADGLRGFDSPAFSSLEVKDITHRPLLPNSNQQSMQVETNATTRVTCPSTPTSTQLLGGMHVEGGNVSTLGNARHSTSSIYNLSANLSQGTSPQIKARDGSRKSYVYVLKDGQTILVPNMDKATNTLVWRSTNVLSSDVPVRIKFKRPDDHLKNIAKSGDPSMHLGDIPKCAVSGDKGDIVKSVAEQNNECYKWLNRVDNRRPVNVDCLPSSTILPSAAVWNGARKEPVIELETQTAWGQRTCAGGVGTTDAISASKNVSRAKRTASKNVSRANRTVELLSAAPRRSGRERKITRPYSPPPARRKSTIRMITRSDAKDCRNKKTSHGFYASSAGDARDGDGVSSRGDSFALPVQSADNADSDRDRAQASDRGGRKVKRVSSIDGGENLDTKRGEGETFPNESYDFERATLSEGDERETLPRQQQMRQLQRRIQEQEKALAVMKQRRLEEIERRKTNPDLVDLY